MNHWTNYWNQGHLTSFSTQLKTTYEGNYQQFWLTKLSSLKDQFSLLDIGCGNGALAILASNILKDTPIKGAIIGCDLAQVTQSVENQNNSVSVTLESQINCEELPYDENKFDLVISQYGIEYSNMSLSLKQVNRVLKPKCKAIFYIHSSDSLVIKKSLNTLTFMAKCHEVELFQTMVDLCESMGKLTTAEDVKKLQTNKNCESKRIELNSVLNQMLQHNIEEFAAFEIANFVKMLMTEKLFIDVAEKVEQIRHFEQEIKSHQVRLQDLNDCALNSKGIAKLLIIATESDFNLVSLQSEVEGNDIMGWSIELLNNKS